MTNLIIIVASMLSSCSQADYIIYHSSEGGGAAIVINGETGEYANVMTGGRGVSTGEFHNRLVTVRGANYLYETQFRIVIPIDSNDVAWGDRKVKCQFQHVKSKPRAVECIFNNRRTSTFQWDKDHGVVSFVAQCLTKTEMCEFKLAGRSGIFSSASKNLFIQ